MRRQKINETGLINREVSVLRITYQFIWWIRAILAKSIPPPFNLNKRNIRSHGHPSNYRNNMLSVNKSLVLCTSQCKPRPPDPQDIAGDVTFLQCYISTFNPVLGGIWTVTIPAPRAPVSKARRALPSRGVWGHAPRENFANVSAECDPGLLVYCLY